MTLSNSVGDLVYALANGVVEAQRRLDADALDRLNAFLPVWQSLHAAQPVLVEAVCPRPLRIPTFQASVDVQTVLDTSREFAVGLAILNLGYQQKYERSDLAKSSVTLEVRQITSMRKED